jgi:hypothetical protein
VLLELLTVFKTVMERHGLIRDLREKHQVPEVIQQKWPSMVTVIGAMLISNKIIPVTFRLNSFLT